MNLYKAIEIGLLNLHEAGPKMPPDCRESLKLLLNAALYVTDKRFTTPGVVPTLLPDETKE